MAFIYKITNDVNQKVYIGMTERTIEERFKEHCYDYKRRSFEKRPLYAAMKKYGTEHFHVELIEETNNPEEREQYWIRFYNSYGNGYNATIGGDGKRYIDYDEIIQVYQEVQNVNKTAQITGHCPKQISQILKSAGIQVLSSADIAKKQLVKPVAKLDPKTDEIITIYSSIQEAENNNGNTRHIAQVCKGKRKICKGYKWKYLTEINSEYAPIV